MPNERDIENGMLNPMIGEQPAEPPATPGLVTVLLTIPWTQRVDDEPTDLGKLERETLQRFDRFTRMAETGCVKAEFRAHGFNLQDIETTATFEPDPEPGDDG